LEKCELARPTIKLVPRDADAAPIVGDALQESEFWSQKGRSSMRERLDRSQALQMLAGSERSSFEWKSWPRRNK
jgi:hypothetical protein